MSYCSQDARKVFNKFPDVDRFLVEQMLFKAYPQPVNYLLGKYDKNIEKILAMLNNGYCKNINRNLGDIPKWDDWKFHYHYLTEQYLTTDFPYGDIIAFKDISRFSTVFIERFIRRLRVKNLWYLRKVLIQEHNSLFEDVQNYKHIEEVKDSIRDIGDKGDKISANNLKEYTE